MQLKEAIRLGGGGGGWKNWSCEIMANHEKRTVDVLLLMASTQVHMSHIQSCINSMRNIMVLILRSI